MGTRSNLTIHIVSGAVLLGMTAACGSRGDELPAAGAGLPPVATEATASRTADADGPPERTPEDAVDARAAQLDKIVTDAVATQLSTIFQSRYSLAESEVRLVVVDPETVRALTGEAGFTAGPLRGSTYVVAYGTGDLVDLGAHPPAGMPPVTGRMAYVLVDDRGALVGAGLTPEDPTARSPSWTTAAVRLSDVRSGD